MHTPRHTPEHREISPPMARSSVTSPSAPGPDVLAGLLSSRVRAAVLGFMVARDGERFSLTELARALDLSISSVQHECYKLERLRVLIGRREGASRRYRFDHETPIVRPLIDLVTATLGPRHLLGHALVGIDGLRGALLLEDPEPRIILIGDLGLEELDSIQHRAARALDVEPETLDVAFYGTDAWQDHRATGSPLIADLRARAPLLLAGNPKEIWPER